MNIQETIPTFSDIQQKYYHYLESEVKQAAENIANKTSGVDKLPGQLFKILQDDAVQVLYMIWKLV